MKKLFMLFTLLLSIIHLLLYVPDPTGFLIPLATTIYVIAILLEVVEE